jgi:catechol 2,3-dioxygenase-like lactoylglutathione lyase family enzyme
MKRFHVHVAVDDLEKSIGFYSALFGAQPTKQKQDYAKWMLDDPRVNFAISARGAKAGVDHFGLQVDAPEALDGLREQIKRADLQLSDEGASTCCYAQSEKSWLQDPNGIAWEAYHTMADAEFFNEAPKQGATACCAPKVSEAPEAAKTGCC